MTEPTPPLSLPEQIDADEYGEYAWLLPGIESTSGEHVVELCRAAVKSHAMACIDGIVVDVQTANAIVQIADNLSPENRTKFIGYRAVQRMGGIAQKIAFGRSAKSGR